QPAITPRNHDGHFPDDVLVPGRREFDRQRTASAHLVFGLQCQQFRNVIGPCNVDFVDAITFVHSAFMPANVMTLAHFSTAPTISCPNCSDVNAAGSMPRSMSCFLIAGSDVTAVISRLSLSTTSRGVSFGAQTPSHPLPS